MLLFQWLLSEQCNEHMLLHEKVCRTFTNTFIAWLSLIFFTDEIYRFEPFVSFSFCCTCRLKLGPRESDGSGFCRDGRHDYDNCVIHIVPCVVHSLFYFFLNLFSVISFFMERTTIKRFPKTQLCPLLRPLDPLVVSSAFAPTSFLLSFPQKARRLVLRGSCFRALWGTAAVTVSQKHSPPHIF